MPSLSLALYSLLMWCAQPILRMKLMLRGRQERGYLTQIEERFGHYSHLNNQLKFEHPPSDQPLVWVHAVSLGETRAAAVLVAELRKRIPGMRLLLTNGTATGRAEGETLLQAGDVQVWQVWDTPFAVKRFLNYFQPSLGILMETELWPNMAQQCAARRIPLAIANARMSEKSFRATNQFAWLAQPAYQSLAAVWAQSEDDAKRFAMLGAQQVEVQGNLKFDAEVDATKLELGRTLSAAHTIIMLASSREGEEAALLQSIQKYMENKPVDGINAAYSATKNVANDENVAWLIVPRHPQRFEVVAQLIESHGFKVARRSQWQGDEMPNLQSMLDGKTILLGDSLGDMALYYGMSDVALLGGSFEPLGGQNLIEAAACACPVVMGPSTFNFAEAAHLSLQAGASVQVNTMQQGVQAALEWVQNAEALQHAQAAAAKFATAHQGAAAKTAQAVVKLLH
ncbi:MAG TPA: 3-deoxy-D-manno-octulosonic acid transferase [Burkholderiaceae bacterium]|nr:3-deoxy-D-manno-octulosonic acid transferase [Burkholderiaceae bacterium]